MEGVTEDQTGAPVVVGSPPMDILGMDTLFAELLLGVGLAMAFGNGFAWWKHQKQEAPDFEGATYRRGRVFFLGIAGLVIATWAGLSLAA